MTRTKRTRFKSWGQTNAERVGRLLDARLAIEQAEASLKKAVRRLALTGWTATAVRLRQRVLPEVKITRNKIAVDHGQAVREAKRLRMKVCKCGFVLSDKPCRACRGTGRQGHRSKKSQKCFWCHGSGKRGVPSGRVPSHKVEGVKMP